MVGKVAHGLGALAGPRVGRVGGGEGTQSVRSEQVLAHTFRHCGLHLLGKGRAGHGNGKDLVGADAEVRLGTGTPGIVQSSAHDILQLVGGAEHAHEGLLQAGQERGLGRGGFAELGGQFLGKGEGVEPQGVELHGASMAGRDGNAVDGGVHPRELGLLAAYMQEAVFVGEDEHISIFIGHGAACEVADDILHHGPADALDEGHFLGAGDGEAVHGQQEPEGGVGGIVGHAAEVARAEEIGHEAVLHSPGYGAKYGLAFLHPAGFEGQAGQGDEGVAAPGAEPVVACGHDGLACGAHEEAVAFAAQMLEQGFLENRLGSSLKMAFPDGFGGFGKGFGAGRDPHGMADAQAGGEHAGHEQVFLAVVAALGFHRVLHLEVPVGGGFEGGVFQAGGGHLHDEGGDLFFGLEGEAGAWSGAQAERAHGGGAGRSGRIKMVDVAAVHQRAHGEAQAAEGACGGSVGQHVAHDEAAGGVVEHDGAGEEDFVIAFAAEGEGEGHAVVAGGGLLEEAEAFGPDDAGMDAAGEGDVAAFEGDGIFQRGKEHVSSGGRLCGEQAVVAAGIAAGDRARGIVAKAVGEEPFAVQAAAEFGGAGTDTKFHKVFWDLWACPSGKCWGARVFCA